MKFFFFPALVFYAWCFSFLFIPIVSEAMDSDVQEKLNSGLHAFYSAQWTEARTIFSEIRHIHPDEPTVLFMEAMMPFWMYFFGGEEAHHAQEFQRKADLAISAGEAHLRSNPNDTTTILMLSGLYGYQSLVAANEGQFRLAMNRGISGYSYTRQLLAMDTDNPNALIGQGVFQYMVGSVPSSVRWMASFAGVRGNKEEGFRLLHRASQTDTYVRVDAAMILAYLLIREARYAEAVDVLTPLVEAYPENKIFQFYHAHALEQKGDNLAAMMAYRAVVNHQKNHLPRLVEKSKDRLQVLTAQR